MVQIQSDEELVVAIQSGDISAFEQLVRRYQQRLRYFVRRFVASREDAAEVVQDTLFVLYQTIERVDTARKVKSYIYTIARHTAISHARRYNNDTRIDESMIGDDDVDVIDTLWNEQRKDAIKRVLNRLTPRYRRVIQLYYLNELSYKEVSAKLHIPINTVRTHLLRAKQALKRHLINYETD